MSPHRDTPKPSAQGERFVALARRIEIARPDEAFDQKFDELTLARPKARRTIKIPPRVPKPR